MTLINNSIYEKTTQQRIDAMEATRKQKIAAHEEREKAKVDTHFQALQTQAAHQPRDLAAPHQIYVHDIRFLVADGGSKLIKAPGGLPKKKTVDKMPEGFLKTKQTKQILSRLLRNEPQLVV